MALFQCSIDRPSGKAVEFSFYTYSDYSWGQFSSALVHSMPKNVVEEGVPVVVEITPGTMGRKWRKSCKVTVHIAVDEKDKNKIMREIRK